MTKEVFQLEVQVQTAPALTGLNSLDKKLKDVKDSADKIGKGTNLNGLSAAAKSATSAFSGLGSVIAGIGFASLATDVVKSISAMENLETVLTTVAGGVTQAADAMKLLKDVSAVTPFSINQLGDSFIKLKAAGLEPSAQQLKLFSDVASVTTDKVGSLQAITDLYARTTAGGLGLEELNRLADRGIPVFSILSDKLGVNRLQLSELGKTAEGAQIILRNLEAGLSGQFGGAAERSMKTLNGQFDILIKNLNNLATSAGGDSTSGITKGLTELLTVLNQVIVSSDGTAKSVGQTLGEALSSLAVGIKTVSSIWGTFVNGLKTANDFLNSLPDSINLVIGIIVGFASGGLALFARAIFGAEKVVAALGTALRYIPGLIANIAKEYPKLAAVVGSVATIMGIGALNKPETSSVLPSTGAGAGRSTEKITEFQDRRAPEVLADQKRAQELLTGRDAIISKIVAGLRQETSLIGLSTQQIEEQNKIYEAQSQIRDKLIAQGKTEAEADAQSKKLVGERAGEIRAAVAEKYNRNLQEQFRLMRENSAFELSMIGKSSNELEKQTKLREELVRLGIKETATEQQKADILSQITAIQEARINESISKNLEGIRKETEYLKLGNEEREKRIALDQAAADAGYKNAEEFTRARPDAAGQIRGAVGTRIQTGINVEGQKQIDQLKEERDLLMITNELDREREKKKLDIYKAIDPEGKGAKILDAQKSEIENLLAQIEAQNKLIEINKKIEDGFATLGDAVTQWALGTEGSIKRVRLALIQLAAMAAFKYLAGGMPTGATGSFLSGVLSGLGGARAEGGPVSANKAYVVGEKRPEIFVPNANGYIIPNTAMLNTQSGNVSVTMAPNLIVQGSVTGQTELENMFEQFAGAIAAETQQFVISQRGQNGILAR